MSPKPKRKPFAGDARHRLPAGMREHYRLWFEFLKLAHRDPQLKDKIDKVFYAPWGEVASDDFDKWWDRHWRDLFGVPLSVVEVTAPSALDALGNQRIILSIDPNSGLEKTLREVKDLIAQRTRGAPRKKASTIEQGRFSLSGNVEVKRLNMQQALKVYALSLETNDLDDIARRYVIWADAWNEKVKGTGRSKIITPNTFRSYTSDRAKGEQKIDDKRRSMRRLLRRARKIAENVARGKFPGDY